MPQEQSIQHLSIREMIARVAYHLDAAAHPVENGYRILIRDHARNAYVSVFLTRSSLYENGAGMYVESGTIRDGLIFSTCTFDNLDHLYITWDTSEMVSFCYAQGGRFSLVNVMKNAAVSFLDGVDRRAGEDTSQQTAAQQEAQAQRRTFYHIGAAFESNPSTTSDKQ